jgi:hypothetical protein
MWDSIKNLFELGFTKRDLVRSIWVFLIAFATTMQVSGGDVSEATLWGAVSAGAIAVKNFLLSDDSALKG